MREVVVNVSRVGLIKNPRIPRRATRTRNCRRGTRMDVT